MEDFTKVVRIGTRRDHPEGRPFSTFCTIKFEGGKLSITGVEGPLSSGNCIGSCGQIDMEAAKVPAEEWTFAEGWDAATLARFWQAWDEWHLNDMHAYDADMKAAGWHEQAKREMLRYRFTLTTQASNDKRQVEAQALEALKAGETFTPSAWQAQQAARAYEIVFTVYPTEPEPVAPEGYERAKSFRTGNIEAPERKTLGWLKPTEHPDGLLTRALVEGGNRYGSAWYREEVPADVLDFLRGLPDADKPLPGAWAK